MAERIVIGAAGTHCIRAKIVLPGQDILMFCPAAKGLKRNLSLQRSFAGVARLLAAGKCAASARPINGGKMRGILAVLLAGGCLIAAARGAEDAERARDEQAVRAAAKQYIEALARGDANTLTALWLPDGDVIDEHGRSTPARVVIEQGAKARQAAKTDSAAAEPAVKLNGSTIRFLTPDVALEDGTVEVALNGRPPRHGRFTAIWVRGGGQWRLATLREARVGGDAASDLAALDAMVGRWTGQAGPAKFDLVVQWNETHTFLERKLTVTQEGHVVLDATQRIAIDPLDGRIRSWMHDSRGGHSESIWIREGDAWFVQGTGVTPDGRRSVSTNTYTFAGPDTLQWKSTGGYSGREKMSDFEIKLERVRGVE
ncbi:MAG TPA: nuclear transport factor 2 family protein [Pirellulales bacterium]|nr:nuclear transport factor 2 family protein [Pirellulales bacterium]